MTAAPDRPASSEPTEPSPRRSPEAPHRRVAGTPRVIEKAAVLGYRAAEWSFAQWQEQGMDKLAKIADPEFVDAAHGDYRLGSGSPALALGIESVDLREAGPRRPK